MNFDESEQTTLLRDTLRRFLDKELPRELARALDKDATYSREAFRKLCELGITGMVVPEEYGGSGVDIMSAIVAIEELARRGTSLGGPFTHCAFYGSLNILENGSEAQKRRLLPRLAKGEILFAYGLSEPDVGGDLASATVTATLSADERTVKINGTKVAIATFAQGNGARTALPARFEAGFTIRSIGVSGVIAVATHVTGNLLNGNVGAGGASGTVTVDTGNAVTLAIGANLSAANAGHSLTAKYAKVGQA